MIYTGKLAQVWPLNPKLPFRSQPYETAEFHNIGQDIQSLNIMG